MIFGCIEKDQNKTLEKNEFLDGFDVSGTSTRIITQSYFAIGLSKTRVPTLDNEIKCAEDSNGNIAVIQGNIFNINDLRKTTSNEITLKNNNNTGQFLLDFYQKDGESLFRKLNGNFAFAILDKNSNKVLFGRDHLGIETLYYFEDADRILFASSLKVLARHKLVKTDINLEVLYRYLLFNYNFGTDTFYKNIRKVRPGYVLVFENGNLATKRYWYLSFNGRNETKSEKIYCHELINLIQDAIRIRVEKDGYRPGAFLSGGLDSSCVVGLTQPMVNKLFHTFSFRCKGKSFDESAYARIMSKSFHTHHHQLEFPAKNTRYITEFVQNIDEPFSDIGIEIASFLLGKAASQEVDYVLTGDGGDELFAGHPVYLADKVAHILQKIPSFLINPLLKTFQHLPDVDQKRSIAVKLKRFSYSFNFPQSLYSNRWRVYYTETEMKSLCEPEYFASFNETDPFGEIKALYQEADGPDYISKALYGDYYTVVDFYLRRMQMIRNFGIEGRLPLMDYRLVEYAAKIPAELKIHGFSDAKFIFRKTLEGVIPDEIIFRKDKLGHSVPMKNWIRESKAVQDLVHETLSESTIKKRGFLNPKIIQTMISQHIDKKQNHSHRLWALMVLELWLENNID